MSKFKILMSKLPKIGINIAKNDYFAKFGFPMTNLVGMDTPLEKKIENFFSLGILKMSQQSFFNFCYGFTNLKSAC